MQPPARCPAQLPVPGSRVIVDVYRQKSSGGRRSLQHRIVPQLEVLTEPHDRLRRGSGRLQSWRGHHPFSPEYRREVPTMIPTQLPGQPLSPLWGATGGGEGNVGQPWHHRPKLCERLAQRQDGRQGRHSAAHPGDAVQRFQNVEQDVPKLSARAGHDRRLPGSCGRHAEKAGRGLSPALRFGTVAGSGPGWLAKRSVDAESDADLVCGCRDREDASPLA